MRLHEEVQNFQQKSTVANNMIVDLQDRIKQLELDFQEQV